VTAGEKERKGEKEEKTAGRKQHIYPYSDGSNGQATEKGGLREERTRLPRPSPSCTKREKKVERRRPELYAGE